MASLPTFEELQRMSELPQIMCTSCVRRIGRFQEEHDEIFSQKRDVFRDNFYRLYPIEVQRLYDEYREMYGEEEARFLAEKDGRDIAIKKAEHIADMDYFFKTQSAFGINKKRFEELKELRERKYLGEVYPLFEKYHEMYLQQGYDEEKAYKEAEIRADEEARTIADDFMMLLVKRESRLGVCCLNTLQSKIKLPLGNFVDLDPDVDIGELKSRTEKRRAPRVFHLTGSFK